MSTTATNPIDAINIDSTPAAPANTNNLGTSSPSKDGKGKPNDNQPIIHIIAPDSDMVLFSPSPAKFAKLDGDYDATITGVTLIELPPREPKPKKNGRKTKGGKGKAVAKSKTSKPSKPGAKLLGLKFQLDEKRADGKTYTVEKEIRGQEDRDSKFGEFMMKILTDEVALNQFFSTYRLSMLLNRRCALRLKEARRKGQSSFKILDVLPAKVSTPATTYTGTTRDAVTGPIKEPVNQLAAAA